MLVASFKIIQTIMLIVIVAEFIYVLAKNRGNHDRLCKSVLALLGFSFIAIVAYVSGVSTRSAIVATEMFGLYFSMIDVLLSFLIVYAMEYTGVWRDQFYSKSVLFSILVLDVSLLLTNYWHGKEFELIKSTIKATGEVYWDTKPNLLFNAHLAISYIMVIMIVIIFVAKIVSTAGSHRRRYVGLLIIFVGIVALNAGFMFFLPITLDFSLTLYGIMGILIAYFTYYHNPHIFVEQMLSRITHKMGAALICFDENDECIFANDTALKIYGCNGRNYTPIKNWYMVWRGIHRSVNEIEEYNWEEDYVIDGKTSFYNVQFSKIYDEAGYFSGCYFTHYDVSAEKQAAAEIDYTTTHDSLTGLANRKGFFKEAREALDINPNLDYILVCSNIKDFKLINDIHGMDVGDKVLIKVADTMRAQVKAGTICGRLDSDRFAMLVPKTRFSEEAFLASMDEIAKVLESSLYKIHFQMGVYEVEDRGISIASMVDRANMAIDSIKDNYRERIAYYGDVLRTNYITEQSIIGSFDIALKNEQFCIYLQPQVKADGTPIGAECLVRWIHPTRGLVPPNHFIPVLEKAGLIHKLDAYVWELAAKQLREWKDKGIDLELSVNISIKDVQNSDVFATIIGLVEKYEISPDKLNLEITESIFMDEPEKMMHLVDKLRDHGFKVEMDDFGSGYSSLNMLKEIKLDILKIDMAFLAVTEDEARSRKIVNMVISLAKALDMTVITEGVEMEEQVKYLETVNCDIYQGYYFAKPMPVSEFEARYIEK